MDSLIKTSFKKRRHEAAEAAFVEAAEAVICQHGYEGARMQDVAHEAGCATGTLYLYFKNKEQLFDAIVTRHLRRLSDVTSAAMDAVQDPLDKLRSKTEAMLRYFEEHHDFVRIFYSASPGGRADVQSNLKGKALEIYLESCRKQLEILKAARRRGRIRKDIAPEELLAFIHGVEVSTMARWSVGDAPARAEQARLLWAFVCGGLVGGARP